jgi:hypothetical protein
VLAPLASTRVKVTSNSTQSGPQLHSQPSLAPVRQESPSLPLAVLSQPVPSPHQQPAIPAGNPWPGQQPRQRPPQERSAVHHRPARYRPGAAEEPKQLLPAQTATLIPIPITSRRRREKPPRSPATPRDAPALSLSYPHHALRARREQREQTDRREQRERLTEESREKD